MGKIIPYIMKNKKCLKPPTSICILYIINHNPHWRFDMFLRFTNSSNYDGTIIPLLSHYNPNQSVNLPLLLLACPGFPNMSLLPSLQLTRLRPCGLCRGLVGKEKRVENQQILGILREKKHGVIFQVEICERLEIIQRMRSVCFILTYFVNVGESK